MKFTLLLAALLLLLLSSGFAQEQLRNDTKSSTTPKLISVTTLTRHGSRAPDKILAQVSCQPLLIKAKPNDPLKSVFVNKFGTLPGELTAFGQVQMVRLLFSTQHKINTRRVYRKRLGDGSNKDMGKRTLTL